MTENSVGRVLGTQHTTTSEFRIVLDDDQYLQLDDLVVVRTQVPKYGEVRTYGIVTEVEAIYEGAQFESDTHRIAAEGILPGAKVRSARVQVTRVDPELWVSTDPGEVAERARGAERDKALYVDEMGRPLPAGFGRDGEPIAIDLDFFDGRKGGHMSISGISGVATKTSFALFFLRLLSARPDVLGEGAANLRILVFNVKGEDLLWLDKPNNAFTPDDAAKWEQLGVEPAPFPSVSFWAPPRLHSGDVLVPDTGGRQEGVDAFAWTPREFVDDGLLRFLFTDAGDFRNQLSFIEERVRSQLQRFAIDVDGLPGALVLRDPADVDDPRQPVVAHRGERVISDLRTMIDAIAELAAVHDDAGDVEIEISIPGGGKLAQKTWNPRLGIAGGLSILGTTGVVIPFSCAAWIESIHRGIDVARAAGLTHVAGCTGRTSEKAVQKRYGLSDYAMLDMGDFAGGLLKYLRRHPVERLTIGGAFAQLAQLGAGSPAPKLKD